MNPDQAAKAIVQTAREAIRRTVGHPMVIFRTGHPIQVRNPFTREPMELGNTEAVRAFAGQVESRGLRESPEFLDSLEKLLLEVAAAPVFDLFAAFDGEGCFADDAQVEIRVIGGAEVPTYLHEILQPINQDLIPPTH